MKKFTSLLLIAMMMLSLVSIAVFTVSADEVETLQISPAYGQIENWGGKTYFITTVTSADNATLYGNLGNGTWKLKLSIADEAAEKTYVVDEYAFDNTGAEIYATSFLRFAVCEYGIPVTLGSTYTVRVEIFADGELIMAGTSDTGAFANFNDGFKADGPVIPDPVPHTSTVVDGVFPAEDIDTTLNVVPKFGGMENWPNSPNKGEEADVYQLLVGALNKNGAIPSSILSTDVVWTLTITGSDGSAKTINVKPATTYGTELVRFETVLQDKANQFIPVAGVNYTVEVSATGADGITYTGKSEEGAFACAADFVPTVPEAYDYSDDPVDPPVEPPVDPGEQPDTDDATVFAIVFATVALMGMGVVVTKKVRA